MHDYQGNRSCLYGPNTETDSEVEDNPEQVTRYKTFTWSLTLSFFVHNFSLYTMTSRFIFNFAFSLNCVFLIVTVFSHIMKELIATERIYVDELLSVLLVSLFEIIVWVCFH